MKRPGVVPVVLVPSPHKELALDFAIGGANRSSQVSFFNDSECGLFQF